MTEAVTFWEYKFVEFRSPDGYGWTSDFAKQADKLGQDRWELVSFNFSKNLGIFKRPTHYKTEAS